MEVAAIDFRSLLRDEFARRRVSNAHYSLRAFARALRVDHSTLSQILRGRRRLTSEAMQRLASRLRIDAPQAHRQLESVLYALAAQGALPPNSMAAARMLGTTTDEINIALQRLIRMRILIMSSRKRWEVSHE
jgi:transcriptional regulator with XRE-family HTH domain